MTLIMKFVGRPLSGPSPSNSGRGKSNKVRLKHVAVTTWTSSNNITKWTEANRASSWVWTEFQINWNHIRTLIRQWRRRSCIVAGNDMIKLGVRAVESVDLCIMEMMSSWVYKARADKGNEVNRWHREKSNSITRTLPSQFSGRQNFLIDRTFFGRNDIKVLSRVNFLIIFVHKMFFLWTVLKDKIFFVEVEILGTWNKDIFGVKTLRG